MSGSAEIDAARLLGCLRARLPGMAGVLRVERIAGGQSNPTYFVSSDSHRLVLRKQPAGELLPSAHAIDREFRVMTALRGSAVPVPECLFYEADAGVIGTPFYVMTRLEGRVFAGYDTPGVSASDRRAMYRAMAETLAALHAVDPAAVGLGDFGRPGSYFARQIARWTKQYELSKTAPVADIETLNAWLPANIPAGETTALCHGDFRLGNLMFHPTEPRVIAVLDWELSTLGDPLADLAFNAMAWRSRPEHYGGIDGLDHRALGIPTEEEHIADYFRAAKPTPGLWPFHFAFALWRFAVIFEGIAARVRAGNAAAADAADTASLSRAFAAQAVAAIDGPPPYGDRTCLTPP
jgi:aminoglycoside phosphotransferase (APT) family kinase protein